MAGAVARNPARNNFSPFRDEMPQGADIFIIDLQLGVDTEAADFPSPEYRPPLAPVIYGHGLYLRFVDFFSGLGFRLCRQLLGFGRG